jgi:hypothetical protein
MFRPSFRRIGALCRAAVLVAFAPVLLSAQPQGVAPHGMGLARDEQLAALLGDIQPARIRRVDSTLVAFGTRNTFSDTLSKTRGIGAARRWLHAQFREIARTCGGCLRVEYDPAMIEVARHPQKPTVNVVNVLAWLPGRDTSRVVVIGGHYDSCICSARGADGLSGAFDATSDAPGADDDGSGTAAVVELARVFAGRYPNGLDATILFVTYAAEEQGLLGSTHLAERLHQQGYTIVAAMTDDIVGNTVADDDTRDASSVRIFSSDDDAGKSRELARYAWAVSELYQPDFPVLPVFRLDRIGRSGDHSPFVRRGDAGLRFTERLENYKRQHLPTDDLAHVDFDYVARVARLNAAVVGALALAPNTPDSVRVRRDQASGGQKWALAWKAVPGATSYEVVVRRTYEPTWTKIGWVGNVTSFLLQDQLDDVWAGVRAVSATGQRSLAAVVPVPTPTPAASVRPAAAPARPSPL